jgi:hypothetical protein
MLKLAFKHMLGVKGRALALDSLKTSLELRDLVTNLILKTVDILFIMLNFDIDFLFEGFDVFAEEALDDTLDLSLVDFLCNFGLFDVHVQLVVKGNLAVVTLALLVGCVVDVDTHLQQLLPLQLYNLLRTLFLHHLQHPQPIKHPIHLLVIPLQHLLVQLKVLLVLVYAYLVTRLCWQDC